MKATWTVCVGVALTLALGACSRGSDESEEPSADEERAEIEAPVESAADESATDELPPPEPEPEERDPFDIEVESGDTLWGLANEHDCSIQAIRDANGLRGDTIRVGQTLTIPPCSGDSEPMSIEPGLAYEIQPGDFLETIASRSGCSVIEIMLANEMTSDAIFAGQSLIIPECENEPSEGSGATIATDDGSYVVLPGDTLGAIAGQHECSIREIAEANGLTSQNIGVGQRLTIPEDCEADSIWDGIEALSDAPPPTGNTEGATPQRRDGQTLSQLMSERGFRAPSNFKGYVIAIRFSADRSRIEQEVRFDYNGTGDDVFGWNPASAVKIYAAIAALQYARSIGFSPSATLTFHGRRDYSYTLRELVQEAIGPSSNIAYDCLITFAGFDWVNGHTLSSRWGLHTSGLRQAYEASNWMEMGFSSSFTSSPAITISEGGRTREIEARNATMNSACGSAACTSLEDLADTLRRVMLQEQLAASQTFELHAEDLRVLRTALRSDRARGEEVVRQLGRHITGDGVRFYHKAGYSQQWYTDNVYVYDPSSRYGYVVALAGYPGRNSLDSAASVIGELIADGVLQP